MSPKKIAWENWKEKVDDSPPKNVSATDESPEQSTETEEEDALEKSFLSAMEIPRLVQTPLGIFHYEDKLKPSEKFDCWIGYTNFDITEDIKDKIECTEGVEALEIMSRYTFFLGVGKMFNFRDVRTLIEQAVINEDSDSFDEAMFLADESVRSSVEIIKEQLSSEKHWAIFISSDGVIDYAKTDNQNDEQYLQSLLIFEEIKQQFGGVILTNE
jgi:hypothetical protein